MSGVEASLEAFDAKTVYRAEYLKSLAGSQDTDRIVVISFKNLKEVDSWFKSEFYQSLIDLRENAADVEIDIFRI